MEASAAGLLIQSEESPALIDRDWAFPVLAGAPVEVSRYRPDLRGGNPIQSMTHVSGPFLKLGCAQKR